MLVEIVEKVEKCANPLPKLKVSNIEAGHENSCYPEFALAYVVAPENLTEKQGII